MQEAYGSARAAIEGAMAHPLQDYARVDASKIDNALLVEAKWSLTDFILEFEGNAFLHIRSEQNSPSWRLLESMPEIDLPYTLGSPNFKFDWGGDLGVVESDWSRFMTDRVNKSFRTIFVNEMGVLLYFHGEEILWFQSVRHKSTGKTMLFLYSGDA
ncbi:MAG: hypothetical protein AAF596_03405 [Planctomycetota bacterium]